MKIMKKFRDQYSQTKITERSITGEAHMPLGQNVKHSDWRDLFDEVFVK